MSVIYVSILTQGYQSDPILPKKKYFHRILIDIDIGV